MKKRYYYYGGYNRKTVSYTKVVLSYTDKLGQRHKEEVIGFEKKQWHSCFKAKQEIEANYNGRYTKVYVHSVEPYYYEE